MKKRFLTVNVKLRKKRKINYKVVNKRFFRIVVFPEEILLEKTQAKDNFVCITPRRKKKIYLNKKLKTLKGKLKKRKVLNAIQLAVKNYKDFPLNQGDYVQLLWDTLDEIEEEVRHIIPIINSSTHNNLMRCLYVALTKNSQNIIKLIEYEVEPISKLHFEELCLSLMDNVLTCNRVVLACCYAQNSYQQVNKPLENLIVLVEHFEIIVEFVSMVILQNQGRVRNYIPSGHIIRHLSCSMCDTVVSLAGCYCTNWALDTLSTKQAKLFANPLEDGPVTSSAQCIQSWNAALYCLKNLPTPEKYRPPLKFTTNHKTAFVETPLVIRDMDVKCQEKAKRRKAVDTIDEVWLCEPQRKSDFKRKAGNDACVTKNLVGVLDEIYACQVEKVGLKRKAEEKIDDLWLFDDTDNIPENLDFDKSLE